jgi:pimeloyl-ACP methyl ester carboxylesterase
MAPLSDVIHLSEPQLPETSVRAPRRTYIIYYVPGNPGLIEYYRIFMTHLYGLLRSQHPECDFEIYGRSLPGFEVGQSQTAMPRRDGQPGEDETGPPYNVNQEIEFTKSEIKQVVGSARAKGKRDVRVILIGHSLGTYITMETIRRLREEAKESPASEERVRVVGGVLLFATVMDLAKSPSGLGKGVSTQARHYVDMADRG